MNTFTETPAASQPPSYEKQPSTAPTLPIDDDDEESIVTFASSRSNFSSVDCRRASLCLSDLDTNTEPQQTKLEESNGRPSFQKRSSILKTDRKKSKSMSLTWNRRLSIEHVFDLEQPELGQPAPPDGKEETATTSDSTARSASKTVKTATTNQVFFMIGCQRSGSNWLRTMLSEREDLIAPHPPHIMRDYMPRLGKYGDLNKQSHLKASILIDHVCAFVERNQVQWVDLHERPMKFNCSAILMDVMIAIECFRFKEKYTAVQEGRDFDENVDSQYYLLAIFDAIMNTMTKANGKKIWMCKSMGMSQFHDLLLSFYGKERLRYIYLVRDPRDVCLSFMKTPVGDCHPYSIAKKWAKLQGFAMHILHDAPDLIHQVCYEEVLGDKRGAVAKIVRFMGARDVCRSMRRGSVIAIKNEEEVVSGAKKGRESRRACQLSYQFKNLARGDSFTAGQFKKWAKEMKDEDIVLVESVAFEEMKRLDYEPHLIEAEDERIHFTEELHEEYTAENKRLIGKMNENLAIVNLGDFVRRKIQAAVLERTVSENYDEEFVKYFSIDIDDVLDGIDEVQADKGFERKSSAEFDFHNWPLNASFVGFQPGKEVAKRLEIQDTRTIKLGDGISITFAAASQAGYYPSDRKKANQDAFIAGDIVHEAKRKSMLPKKAKGEGALFAVFDGHGPNGHECARSAVEGVRTQFVGNVLEDSSTSRGTLDESAHVSALMKSSYQSASTKLETGSNGIASHSGTTATSLFITKNHLHTANVGDSRCLLVENGKDGKTSVTALTEDHTPDREDEIKRIEAHGGVVMTSDQYDNNDPTFTSFEQKRIWSKEGKWPGTAFTRSIGDAVAKELGVVADPECADFPIPSTDATFVLGSDGVFDFIPDDEIGAVVNKYKDPADVCRELIGKAFNRWSDSEERTDDITVIVGRVKRSNRSRLGGKLQSRLGFDRSA